jgi:hypothetical protein
MISKMPRAAAYGAGRFVVVGDNLAMSSTNGYDWQDHSVTGNFGSLIFANGRFVAVRPKFSLASTNGTDWVQGDIPVSFGEDLIFGNGIFLASGSTTNAISTDGISWEAVPFLPAGDGSYTIGFGEGKFVCITIRSDIMTSVDGRNWVTHGKLNVTRPSRIAWGHGYFVTAGGGSVAYSDDALNWTIRPGFNVGGNVVFIDGRFIAAGYRSVRESDLVIQLLLAQPTQLEIRAGRRKQVQVQATDQLLDGQWQEFGSPLTTNDDGTAFSEIPTGNGQLFFRGVLN